MLRGIRPPVYLWDNAADQPPRPIWLLVAQRSGAGVALALPCVALGFVVGSAAAALSALREWLALATVALVVLLAARVAAAVQRWHLGNSDLLELVHATRSVLLLACSFVAPASASPAPDRVARCARFVADLKRLLLVYVALALQDCRDIPTSFPTDQLRPLLDDDGHHELDELRRWTTNKPRASVVELWIRTRVSQACFAGSAPLLPHAAQAMELHRIVSTLPVLSENAARAWRQPPVWGILAAHTPRVVFAYLVFYAAVHALPSLLVLLWVFSWGIGLFGLDALAHTLERRHRLPPDHEGEGDEERDVWEQTLLTLQDEIDAAARAFFRSNGGLVHWERWNRSLRPLPRRIPRPGSMPPRSTSSIAPASPPRSPRHSRAPGSMGSDEGRDLGKSSLKHVLDMITTSSSSPSTVTRPVDATAAERRPLLQAPATPRYDLFLRREDERSGDRDDDHSDATDVEEEEGEEEQHDDVDADGYHLPV